MITNAIEQVIGNQSVKTKKPLKILLVDDIPANLLTLEGILEDENRILIKSFSGNEALKLLMEEPIDLILLDIQMPDMDGIEVAQLLRANPKTRHIPIIFVSAIAKSERPSFSEFEPGSFDFIPKPLDIEETQKIVSIFELGCRYRLTIKEQEEKINRLNDHLDKFLYILSHDLNAPLRAIENLVQWLEEDLAQNISDESKENIILLRNRVDKMKLLLDGLMRYSQNGSVKYHFNAFNPQELLNQIFSEVNTDQKATLKINTQVQNMETDKQALQTVFRELFKNCIMFNQQPVPQIEVELKKDQTGYEFVFADNGPGIKPQQQKTVFEMFQTLHSSYERTSGVGLTIVKKIVEDFGGTVWIAPNSKSGLQIHFTWRR